MTDLERTFIFRKSGNYWTGRGYAWIDVGNPLYGRIVTYGTVLVGPARPHPQTTIFDDPEDEEADVVDDSTKITDEENFDGLTLICLARIMT